MRTTRKTIRKILYRQRISTSQTSFSPDSQRILTQPSLLAVENLCRERSRWKIVGHISNTTGYSFSNQLNTPSAEDEKAELHSLRSKRAVRLDQWRRVGRPDLEGRVLRGRTFRQRRRVPPSSASRIGITTNPIVKRNTNLTTIPRAGR